MTVAGGPGACNSGADLFKTCATSGRRTYGLNPTASSKRLGPGRIQCAKLINLIAELAADGAFAARGEAG
jgi:hypothetical protein